MPFTLHQLLFRAYHGQNSILQPVREELGLGRGQPRILSYLLDHGPSAQSGIAAYFGTDPASVSRMTEILRQNGFLIRAEDENCRRANKLMLTEKGEKAARIWKEEGRRVNEIILRGFSKEESETLRSLLERVVDNLREPSDG